MSMGRTQNRTVLSVVPTWKALYAVGRVLYSNSESNPSHACSVYKVFVTWAEVLKAPFTISLVRINDSFLSLNL